MGHCMSYISINNNLSTSERVRSKIFITCIIEYSY